MTMQGTDFRRPTRCPCGRPLPPPAPTGRKRVRCWTCQKAHKSRGGGSARGETFAGYRQSAAGLELSVCRDARAETAERARRAELYRRQLETTGRIDYQAAQRQVG